jgi:hypothetical protein
VCLVSPFEVCTLYYLFSGQPAILLACFDALAFAHPNAHGSHIAFSHPDSPKCGIMQASVSPLTIAANNPDLESKCYELEAIKIFMNEGANPLDVAQAHLQGYCFVQDAGHTFSGLFIYCQQNGIDQRSHSSVFSRLDPDSYVHYTGIVARVPRDRLLKSIQAVGPCSHPTPLYPTDTRLAKDVTSLRAPPSNTPLPQPVIHAKRGRAELESNDTSDAIIVAGRYSNAIPLEKFCGPKYRCKSPAEYEKKGWFLNHIKNKHTKDFPSTENPWLCCNTPYPDITQYTDHHWDTHRFYKGVALGANPLGTPTPEHGPPLLNNCIPPDTRSASAPGASLPPNNGIDMYSNPVTQPLANIGSMPGPAFPHNTGADIYPNAGTHPPANTGSMPSNGTWLPFSQDPPLGDYSYDSPISPFPVSMTYPPMHNECLANHAQQQRMMTPNYPVPEYHQPMYDTDSQPMHYEPAHETDRTGTLPSQYSS